MLNSEIAACGSCQKNTEDNFKLTCEQPVYKIVTVTEMCSRASF